MKTERDSEEGLDRVGEDGYGSDDSGEFFMIFGKTSAYMKVDATVRPMMWHMSDGEEEYLTEPMELYSVERDAEYMTVPVHEEADSGDIDFDVEEETDEGQRGRKEDGVGLCDDKLRGKRLEAYTEWRFRHGEEGVVCEDDLYGGGSAGEENDDEDVKVYALKVTTEEIEIAKGEQEESDVHSVYLGCCERPHRCRRLGKKEGEGWLKVCYAAMDGAPSKVIGIYMYTREEQKFRRSTKEERGGMDIEPGEDESWTVDRLKRWCRNRSYMYLKLLSRS